MFDFSALYEAHTVEEAVALRKEHPGAMILAGGSDVFVKLREGKLRGRSFISIFGIDELRGVTMEEDGTIAIGALTCFTDITNNPIIQQHIPVLGEAVDQVGGPQIRNIGTIGGNVSNGVTSADSAATLLAWDAGMELEGDGHSAFIPMSIWYKGPGRVNIGEGEILTRILIHREDYEGYTGSYYKYAMRNAMDIALTGCSVNVKLSADRKTFENVRIAFGVAAAVPVRAKHAESVGRGAPVCEDTVKAIAAAVTEDIAPRTSWRATAELRTHVAKELTARCLRESILRGGGVVL